MQEDLKNRALRSSGKIDTMEYLSREESTEVDLVLLLPANSFAGVSCA